MAVKKYYRIKFSLESPLNIGCSVSFATDKDVIKDSNGNPFIPGSSLAGVYRSLFSETKQLYEWFGNVEINRSTQGNTAGEAIESKIRIYDALLFGKKTVGIRDCVSLDEFRTAKKGSKFDFEVIEPGTEFITFVEVEDSNNDPGYGDEIARAWKEGRIFLGAKTARGLGSIKCLELSSCEFDFNQGEDIEKWIDFDMFGSSEEWKEPVLKNGKSLLKKNEDIEINLHLKQEGGVSVRKYTTEIGDEGKTVPDYKQLKIKKTKEKKEEYAVIPGTSWAGIFRHRMEEYAPGSIESMFGAIRGPHRGKSSIRFSETYLSGGTDKLQTRVSIDRITGGAQKNALFTERTYYDGEGDLVIIIPEKSERQSVIALLKAIADLNAGFLTVGGLSAVGRGFFSVTEVTINGKTIYTLKKDGQDNCAERDIVKESETIYNTMKSFIWEKDHE